MSVQPLTAQSLDAFPGMSLIFPIDRGHVIPDAQDDLFATFLYHMLGDDGRAFLLTH